MTKSIILSAIAALFAFAAFAVAMKITKPLKK